MLSLDAFHTIPPLRVNVRMNEQNVNGFNVGKRLKLNSFSLPIMMILAIFKRTKAKKKEEEEEEEI